MCSICQPVLEVATAQEDAIMMEPLLPSIFGTQSRSIELLTTKTVVRKTTVMPEFGA